MAVFVLANRKASETGGVLRGPAVASSDSVDGAAWAEVTAFLDAAGSAITLADALTAAGGPQDVELDVTATSDVRALITSAAAAPTGAARGWFIPAGASITFAISTGDRIYTRTP